MQLPAWIQKHFSIKKFFKYALGGALSFGLNILLTYFLTEVLGLYYLVSFAIALTLVTLFNFVFAIKYIFQVKQGIATKLVRYIISVVILYFVNLYFVQWLVEGLGLHYTLAIFISTGLLFLTKFLWYDKIVFAA